MRVDELTGTPSAWASLGTSTGIGLATAAVTALLVYAITNGPADGMDFNCCALALWVLVPPGSGYLSGRLVGRITGCGRFLLQPIQANPFVYLVPLMRFLAQSILANPFVYLVAYMEFFMPTVPGTGTESSRSAVQVDLFFLVMAWMGTAVGLRSGSKGWRRPRGAACGACGHNLTGNVSGRCPECGIEIPPAQRAALGITAKGSEVDRSAGV